MSNQRLVLLTDVDGNVTGDPFQWNGGRGVAKMWFTALSSGFVVLEVDVSGDGDWAVVRFREGDAVGINFPTEGTIGAGAGAAQLSFLLAPCLMRARTGNGGGTDVNMVVEGHDEDADPNHASGH